MIQKLLHKSLNILKELRKEDNLKTKATLGTIWLGAGNGFEQGLRLLRNMILTRLLAPEIFGVMAIVIAINTAFQSFTEIGIKQAIIQNPKGQERTYLNGAWWLSFLRAVGLYFLAFAAIPYVSKFYDNPELLPLMRIAFLSLLFNGLMSSRAYVAMKQMDFMKWVIIRHGGGALGIIITIALAFVMRNVWALVIGFTLEAAVRCILSFIICPFRPGFKFEKESLHALLRYSRGMVGLPIFTFIFMRADVFVVGKFCTASDLGLYTMAVGLANLPIQFSTILAEIMMPAFSKIHTDMKRINQLILKITSVITLFGFPVLIFVILCGKDILSIIYGAQYAQVAVPFAIVFATAVIRICSRPIVTVYFAIGRPGLNRIFVVIRAILIVIIIIPAVKNFGLTGAAMAGFIASLSYIFQVFQIRSITDINLYQYSLVYLRALTISIGGIIVWLVAHAIMPSIPFSNLIAGFLSFLLASAFAIYFFYHLNTKSSSFMFVHTKQ